MKKIMKVVLYLLGFIALLLIFTVVINLPVFDEELLPEVVAIKNIKAEPFSKNNAYPAMLAINARSGKSLQQATEEVRAFLNQKIKDTGLDYLDATEYQSQVGRDHDENWLEVYSSCKSRSEKNCMQQLSDQLKIKSINEPRLIEQLLRYKDLIAFSHYKEVTQLDFNVPFGPYGPLMKIKQIYLSDALVNQPSDVYMKAVFKDLVFWRMILKDSHLLITNMVSVASLSDSINNVSVAIKQNLLNEFQLKKLQENIKPLNRAETDLGRVFDYEFKYGLSMMDSNSIEGGGFFDKLLYQPQATHNTRYLLSTKHLKKVAGYKSNEFYQYENSKQLYADFNRPVKWSLSMLYNPVGKILISHIMPAYKNYFGRVHDLNGMFYLLKLQIEIALNPNKTVEQVVTNSEFTNPYTLKPMGYNKASHSIYFECMDKTSVCELDL